MLALFFLIWIIFNGKVTVEIILFGFAVSGAMFWFICKFMGYSREKEKLLYRLLPDFGRYLWVLIVEIFHANIDVCFMILSRRAVIEPAMVHIHTELKTETAKMILANSITLTPGTITVSMTGQELLVHCLDKSIAEGMEQSDFVKLLEKMEREANV